ncbi:MAG: hypothetical protein H0W87_04960 [Actinobacteria bacterium]|nr:hypothetical protein [Actinomycetota bacterium]
MRRPLTALVVALASVVLTAAASSAPAASTAPCTLLAAKSGILASDLPMRVKQDAAGGKGGAGIDRLLCRDLTSDGRKDMVASVYSGTAIGVEAWVFFRSVADGWKLSFRRIGLVRARIQLTGVAVIETDPVYRPTDKRPCCPTGGMKHFRFEWQDGKMAKVRVWQTGRT